MCVTTAISEKKWMMKNTMANARYVVAITGSGIRKMTIDFEHIVIVCLAVMAVSSVIIAHKNHETNVFITNVAPNKEEEDGVD